jgi:DNA-binding response OmpR family regulator
MEIVFASPRIGQLGNFLERLEGGEFRVLRCGTGMGALELAKSRRPGLVIIDEGLPGFAPAALIAELMRVNAMINTAVLSALPEVEFHERFEGLGVLACLPILPGAEDAERLLNSLNTLSG